MGRETQLDDGADAVREWRWRSYLDHLEDLGYDLDSGALERETQAGDGANGQANGALSTDVPRSPRPG
jgi:hypothetical protein